MFVAPSCSCNEAVIVLPHTPLAVKVKFCVALAPGAMTPYVAGPLRVVMPPLACKVPTRFVVAAVPTFVTPRLIVTTSFGSGTPLAGVQLSAVRLEPAAATIAPGPPFGIFVNRTSGWFA